MTLKTWSFSKKKNSTAQPATTAREYTVYMKENTSIEHPVFILGTGIDAGVSYCQAFGNYYFVDDIVLLTKDQVELHCSLDPLATHKTVIGNLTTFIERASAAHNAYIYDSALSATQKIVASAIQTNALWTIDQTGCFVVRTVGDGGGATGISSWVVTASELGDIIDYLFDENNPDFADMLTDGVVKSFFNPFQYIISVMWFPFSKSDIPGSSDTMQLGFWSPGNFKRMSSGFFFDSVDLTKPTNYYSDDFRAYHPSFTTFRMFLPGIGVIDLDPLVLSHEHLTAYTTIDYATGNINIRLQYRDSADNVKGDIGSYSGQVGVSVPVGQINGISEGLAMGSVMESAVGGAISAAESFLTGGGVSGILNTIKPTSSIIGNPGNMGQMAANPRLISSIINYGCGEFPNTVYGRPLCSIRQISTLSGFIKCQGASIALDAPDTEIEAVNNYLNTGFYYE